MGSVVAGGGAASTDVDTPNPHRSAHSSGPRAGSGIGGGSDERRVGEPGRPHAGAGQRLDGFLGPSLGVQGGGRVRWSTEGGVQRAWRDLRFERPAEGQGETDRAPGPQHPDQSIHSDGE